MECVTIFNDTVFDCSDLKGGAGGDRDWQLTWEALDWAQSLPLLMALVGEIPVETL